MSLNKYATIDITDACFVSGRNDIYIGKIGPRIEVTKIIFGNHILQI